MRKFIVFALAAGSAALAVPISAQNSQSGSTGAMPQTGVPRTGAAMPTTDITPAQRMQYDSWSAQERSTYDGWAADHQAYFWALPPQRQSIYWRLSEADRATIAAMPDPDRETAWARVESQVAQQADNAAAPSESDTAEPAPQPEYPQGDPAEDPPMK